MNHIKAILKGTLADVLADIKNLTLNGELVYPNYPDGYEVTGATVLDRFIVTEPRQEVLTPAEFSEEGEETSPAVMGDYIAKLVLPSGYDTSGLTTLV